MDNNALLELIFINWNTKCDKVMISIVEKLLSHPICECPNCFIYGKNIIINWMPKQKWLKMIVLNVTKQNQWSLWVSFISIVVN